MPMRPGEIPARAQRSPVLQQATAVRSRTALSSAFTSAKALVYRYFGDLDGLLKSYASSALFWPTVEELTPDREALLALPFVDRYCTLLTRYARSLRTRPATLSILAAEMTKRTALHAPIEASREAFGHAMLELTHDAPAGVDFAAITSVLSGAIHYLLLRARHIALFNGIALRTDEGFARIAQAIEQLARATLSTAGLPPAPGRASSSIEQDRR